MLRRRPRAVRVSPNNDTAVSDDEDTNGVQDEDTVLEIVCRNSERAQRRLQQHWRRQRKLVDVANATAGQYRRIETTPDGKDCSE